MSGCSFWIPRFYLRWTVSCSWVMIFNQITIPIEIYLRRIYWPYLYVNKSYKSCISSLCLVYYFSLYFLLLFDLLASTQSNVDLTQQIYFTEYICSLIAQINSLTNVFLTNAHYILKASFEYLCPGPDLLIIVIGDATHPRPSYDISVVIVPNAQHEQTTCK